MKSAKSIREKRGYSQEYVAKAIGMSQEAISQYEVGTRTPTIVVARKIAKLYKVSLDDIFFGNDISK